MNLEACVAYGLSQLSADIRTRFATDALGVLRSDLGLTVTPMKQLTNSREDGGACDGVSFLQDGVILYAPTPASRRENFTLAHELGHWLVENTTEIYDWLGDQDEPARLLETVCDMIAQRLLLPDEAIRDTIGDGPICARHLLDLYDRTQASRPVCGIGLAKYLPGLGAVVILDRSTGEVANASVKPDAQRGWPTVFPWRGQAPGEGHLLLRLQRGSGLTRRLNWSTPWGTQAEYYVDAIADDKRVYAVFSDSDLWGIDVFHPVIERSFDTRLLLRGRCCGTAFEVRGYPCPTCSAPFCPKCQRCGCDREAEKEVVCTGCWLRFRSHLVVDGRCVTCRE